MKYKLHFAPAKVGWPTKINYCMTAFVDLAQKEVGDWFDVIGVVVEVQDVQVRNVTPKDGMPYELHVRTVTLRSGDFHEELELMGRHAASAFKLGDVLAAHTVCLKEWNQKKLMYTGWVTHIDINPTYSETCVKPGECDTEGTITKKAAGMREVQTSAVQAVNLQS